LPLPAGRSSFSQEEGSIFQSPHYCAGGHGLYVDGLELMVIASVVMGGTMLTGGVGCISGTMFGVLLLTVTQTLIQTIGKLSSWWTNIVVGVLTLVFIGVQS
jgi:ribose/xylose/arabinose/galactoside ABC-type transport system permease subunit